MWITVSALVIASTALITSIMMWRKVRRMEAQLSQRTAKPPYSPERAPYDGLELTLEAMLEELEIKGQAIMKQIEQRGHVVNHEPPSSNEEMAASHVSPPPTPDNPKLAPMKVEAVHRLADEGHDVLTIAQRLGLGKGEVQLILELRRQHR